MSYYENIPGTVKSYDDGKGLGWITPDHGAEGVPDFGGADIAVSARIVKREDGGFATLKPGERVSFDVQCLSVGKWNMTECRVPLSPQK